MYEKEKEQMGKFWKLLQKYNKEIAENKGDIEWKKSVIRRAFSFLYCGEKKRTLEEIENFYLCIK